MKTEKTSKKKSASKALDPKEINPPPIPPKSPPKKPSSDAHLYESIEEPKIKYIFGRPTKYEHRFCQMVVDHMEKGFTFDSFAGVISVNRDTLYEWRRKYPDFSVACSVGNSKRRLCDEETLEKYAQGEIKTSPHSLIFKFKALHGVTDDVIGLKKLKMIQMGLKTPEEIREMALKVLKEDNDK